MSSRLQHQRYGITKVELTKAIGIIEISIWRNIEAMRNKYFRRVGPDKGGFWEIIKDE
jgi:ATP-dependent DNA helicase RecG